MVNQENSLPDDDRTRIAPPISQGGDARGWATGTQNALPLGTILGEFEITALIGEGGFGIVYLAYDVLLQRKVALKEYLPSALAVRKGDMTVSVSSERHADTFQAGLRSFINEAQLLARFDHPSLVKVYRFWQANGTAYMVMPYYEGATLKEALRQLGRPPDESWLKNILGQLMEALEVIHGQQCFHRDIAPDNIILLGENRPVLLDFGAARRVISDMTQAMTVILKPDYAPIEQYQYAEVPSMKQGPWTDCYALAAVVYFAITGKPLAPAIDRFISDPVIPLARAAEGRYSDRFLRGIDAALAVKPEMRPQSIAEFRELLGLPQRGAVRSDGTAGSKHVDESKRPWLRLRTAVYALGVAVALGAGGAAFLFQRDRIQVPPTQEPIIAKPFEPSRVLDEIFASRDATHDVMVSVNGIQGNGQVRVGKLLRLSIRSSKAGYIYLFMLDNSQSHLYLLFPNIGKSDIRLNADQQIELRPLEATGPPGVDRYLAMVSDEPRQFDASAWQAADRFREFPLDKAATLFASPNWSVQLFSGTAVCPGATTVKCANSFGASQFTVEEIE